MVERNDGRKSSRGGDFREDARDPARTDRADNGAADSIGAAILRGLLEGAPEAMLVVDRDDRIVLASVRAADLFGCRREALIGRSVASLVPDLRKSALDEVTGLRADGSSILLEIQRASLQTPLGLLLTASLRPVVAAPVVAGEKRLRSEFVANMSHVLRTPLNSIIGFARLMHHGKVGPVSDRHREFLGDILNSANHLLVLINDVLDLSKVDAGAMEFHPEPIDVPQLVGEVRDIVAAMAAAKQVRIDVAIDPSCTGVHLDPGKLKQVVYNLMSNALKFTERGRIEVRVMAEDNARWRFEVEDTGLGMSADDLARVFADGDGKRLGLVLTKRLVEAQGGQIGVCSSPGKGSTFTAIFPRMMSLAGLPRTASAVPASKARS